MSGWGRGTPFRHLASNDSTLQSSSWLCLAPVAVLLMGGQSGRGSWLGRSLRSSTQQCESEPFGNEGHKCNTDHMLDI